MTGIPAATPGGKLMGATFHEPAALNLSFFVSCGVGFAISHSGYF